jgi:hypothetical protein
VREVPQVLSGSSNHPFSQPGPIVFRLVELFHMVFSAHGGHRSDSYLFAIRKFVRSLKLVTQRPHNTINQPPAPLSIP